MLGLTLREEFRGRLLKGTAIELANDSQTGATQVGAKAFLDITYPTHDLLKAIEAASPGQGRPVAVIGERGAGKSHLMAALFHAVNDPPGTRQWLDFWAGKLGDKSLSDIQLRSGMLVIGDSLHRQRYKFLWDLLLDKHPHGSFIRGKWEGAGAARTEVLPYDLVVQLLRQQPAMLLLDEFQTWFDGLSNSKQAPQRSWAFNFIQILSEVAKEHPDLLVLVISVRNGSSDAYQQVHRVNPVVIDFMAGGNAQRVQDDRRRMLLHRLFENRLQVTMHDVQQATALHAAEYFRLLDVPAADQERRRREFAVSWPFAPHLLRLLEEQVLIATDAQETRDLIRILASLYKARGDRVPVLTAADFLIDDDSAGIGALLDSVSNAEHRTLRAKVQQNIIAVTQAVPNADTVLPHLHQIMGALWLRSIAVGNLAGAEPAVLQADISRSAALDDNAFQVELGSIVDNSFNIHRNGNRLVLRSDENPQARLMAHARNDRLFADGSDQRHLAREARYVFAGEVQSAFVIALPANWLTDPWSSSEPDEQPDQWTDQRPPLLLLPEEPEALAPTLGRWLRDHLQRRRNTVRFVLPRAGLGNAYQDRELLILARATLKAHEWAPQNPEYRKLHTRYQTELREVLKKRFDRFAVLQRWQYTDPALCSFSIEPLSKQGPQMAEAIQATLADDLFVPEDFEAVALAAAAATDTLGKLLRELQEPRPGGQDCIPWLGESVMKDKVLRLCARGRLALNLGGRDYLQAEAGEDEDSAWKRMRSRLPFSGRQLDDVKLLEPSAVPSTGGTVPAAAAPAITPTGVGGSLPLFAPGPAPVPPPGVSAFAPPAPAGDPKPQITLSNPSTSALNLIKQVDEAWAIKPATRITEIAITISAASGAQLRDILRKLPDGLTFALSLQKDDE